MDTQQDLSRTPQQTIRFRKAFPREAQELARFLQAMALDSEGLVLNPETVQAGVNRVFEEPELGTYWVLDDTEHGRLVGMTLITQEWSDWHNAPYWWFQSVYIHPDYRGQGLVNQLMTAVEAEARKEGVKEMRLYVEHNNRTAIRVYEKAGYDAKTYQMMQKSV